MTEDAGPGLEVSGGAHVVSVAGARPNFVKLAPIIARLRRTPGLRHTLIHTGQHYDDAMSQVFLKQLRIGPPDHHLNVGSGTHAVQTAGVMQALEPILTQLDPNLVLVPGDVNSTLAAALVAAKLQIPVAHLEAGLRSFDRSMPEEINRVVTDATSTLLFTHSPEARGHLIREGRPPESIHEVGNTMIDTLVAMKEEIREENVIGRLGVDRGAYLVVTLHRPSLVDGPLLRDAVENLAVLARKLPVVFAVHPRTLAAAARAGVQLGAPGITVVGPLGYVEFLSLVASARAVLTDSGGLQEETTFLGVPCFTLRDNTERPVTCTSGTNQLLGLAPSRIPEILSLLQLPERPMLPIPGWDGAASGRTVRVILDYLREPFGEA